MAFAGRTTRSHYRPRGFALLLALSLGILLLASLWSQLPVQAQVSPAPPALMAKAQQQGSLRLIVGLDLAFRPEGRLSAIQADAQRQRIAQVQDQVIQKLQGRSAQGFIRFKYIPYLALQVDAAALSALAAMPEIASLDEDVPVPPALASANAVIGTGQVWAQGYTGQGQTVAILDTGVDKNHPFFSTGGSKVVSEACYSTNSAPNRSSSVCPGGVEASTAAGSGLHCDNGVHGCDHGTHVAGIAAGDDNIGPNIGVARGADLIAIQVFSRFDGGQRCTQFNPCALTWSSDQIRGLERVYELRNEFDIAAVNMSLGGGQYSEQSSCDADNASRKAAIDNLRSVGIATIVAAGNSGYTNSLGAPGCISTVISVGATDDSDNVASFSNVASFLDLLAPGVSINSSVPGGGISDKSGTSMAAPMVSGAWAVARSISPTASIDDLLARFRESGVSVDDTRAGGTITDMRRINLAQLMDLLAPRPTIRKSASTAAVLPGAPLTYTLVVANDLDSQASGIIITDTVPPLVTLNVTSLSGDAASSGTTPGSLITWTTGQNLAPGQSLTRTFVVTASEFTGGGIISNTAYVRSSGAIDSRRDSHTATLVGIAACDFNEGFEAGRLSPYWQTHTTNDGRVRVASTLADTFSPHNGSYQLVLDDAVTDGTLSEAAVVLTADLSGQVIALLDFWWRENADENHPADGVFISDDQGTTWHQLFSFNNGPANYTQTSLDIAAAAADAGLLLNETFQIKFQFFDNSTFEVGDGYTLDDIRLRCQKRDVAISQEVSPAAALPGQVVTYTLSYANQGSETAGGVIITTTIPASVTNRSLASSGATITQTSPAYAWQVSDLAPGAGGLITITGLLSQPLPAGSLDSQAQIGMTGPDDLPGNNEVQALLTVLNAPPVAADDQANSSFTTGEDTPLTTGSVLANDSDLNGDLLSVAGILSDTTQGILIDNGDGTFNYDPDGQFNALPAGEQATDSFAYVASDGLLTDTAVVTITIQGANDLPLAAADAYTTTTDQTLMIPAPGVLGNDRDPDLDDLTAILQTAPLSGSLSLAASGAFTYTPAAAFSTNQTVTYTYRASDGLGSSDVTTVTLYLEQPPGILLYLPAVLANPQP